MSSRILTSVEAQRKREDELVHRARRHNAKVASELKRAEAGEIICLSDLMAEHDEIVVDEIKCEQTAMALEVPKDRGQLGLEVQRDLAVS